jgi:DNA-binding response OmpR family regulator
MGDAWIYGERSKTAEETAQLLAELGYSPRRVEANGSLRPAGDGAVVRRPDVALVLGDSPDAGELCSRLRRDEDLGEVPVVLTIDVDDLPSPSGRSVNAGLLEANELIVAPFTAAEMGARIARARLAVHGVDEDEVVRVEDLELNLATYQVTVGGEPVDFTYVEYELLKFLMTHPRRVFSREALLSRVWGYDYYGGQRTVDVHVRRVRAKLGSRHAERITTVRSVGYRFDP